MKTLFIYIFAALTLFTTVLGLQSPALAQGLDHSLDKIVVQDATKDDSKGGTSVSSAASSTSTLSGKIQMSVSKNYQIGPGDVLSVSIYHQPDLSQDNVLVRSDGMASFNAIGEMDLNGKTVAEVTEMLKLAFSDLVIDPMVTVNVSRTRPSTVYLAGAVMKPGMFQMTTNPGLQAQDTTDGIKRFDMKISNILSHAGGVRLNADLTRVEVQNPESGKKTVVNLWRLLKEGASEEDVWVQSGDTIYVPKLENQMAIHDEDYTALLMSPIGPQTFPVRMIGQVSTPGVIQLNGTSPYLVSAISSAGGFKDSANTKMVAIRRFSSEGSFSTLYVDPNKMDFVLRPNDVIYISENKIYKAGRFMSAANKILEPFQTIMSMGANSAIYANGGFGSR